MRWSGQELGVDEPSALPGLARLNNLVRSVQTPEFAGITFHEVLAKSALNRVPGQSAMPFGWTINPYRGCSHACTYCLGPDTLISMADGSVKPLGELQVGDEIVGTEVSGRYRRYVATTVRARWHTRKPAFRVHLHDGTTVVASGDHRFLTERGWKHVTGATAGSSRRPHLTTNDALTGFGLAGLSEHDRSAIGTTGYRRGYLCGMIRGDAMMLRRTDTRPNGQPTTVSRFRLSLADREALDRSREYLCEEGITTDTRPFSPATDNRREMTSIMTAKARHFDAITAIVAWPAAVDQDWCSGFLAGVFDAEGSCSAGILRISNTDAAVLEQIMESMRLLGITCVLEPPHANGVRNVRVTGGLPMRERFFRLTEPAILRKRRFLGRAVTSNADLRVASIEPIGEQDLIDITTGTGDFIANGVISHNCFARPTHTYLDLDAGKDFDSQLIVKVNVAEVLAKELAKPSWGKHPVALGTNTDPYQRAEGKYRLMPDIIRALADSGTPFSILTKGTLLRRDLPLLADVATQVPVDLAMSIAIFDDELQQSIEPGTPTAAARLATVRAASDLGFDVGVFMMPILPYLTDTVEHLDLALTRIREAGASTVLYSALHLKSGVKPWFMHWLSKAHPELVAKYSAMYAEGMHAPKDYRRWLAARIRPMIRDHGLERGREDPSTGGVRSSALGMLRNDEGERVRFRQLAPDLATTALQPQPTLF
ncbi:intein-containing Rv2578c family radical SAM protein [Plantibacter flavus]|uniref:intein-containing Rv2578c family radical SAM protein n=1 Tax=Plantibacter flavus TaxID=150123 RepID=UPI003F16C9E1